MDNKKKLFLTYIFIIMFVNIIFATIFYNNRSGLYLYNVAPNYDPTWYDCYYFTTVSYFTVGYGDIVPLSNKAKLICIIHLYVAYSISALGLLHLFGVPKK